MNAILFIQGGGHQGYEADKKLVAGLQNALGRPYEINYPEIHSNETASDFGWTEQISEIISRSEDDLIVVAHSLGASMLLKSLSENPVRKKIKGIFLLATPYWSGHEDWKQGLKLDENFSARLPENLSIYFYHGKDDEEVPFSHLQEYRKRLARATFREIDTGGHQLNSGISIVAEDIKSLSYSKSNQI